MTLKGELAKLFGSVAMYRLTLAFLVFLALVFGLALATEDRDRYFAQVESGTLAPPTRETRIILDDEEQNAIISEVYFSGLFYPYGEEIEDFSVVTSGARSAEDPEVVEALLKNVVSSSEPLSRALAGTRISSYSELDPFVSFAGQEHRLIDAMSKEAERNPDFLRIAYSDEEEAFVSPEGRSLLLNRLWEYQNLTLPKISRLLKSSLYVAAKNEATLSAQQFRTFEIGADALDATTRNRLSIVYLAEILLNRPEAVALDPIEAIDIVASMQDYMNWPSTSGPTFFPGDTLFHRFVGIAEAISRGEDLEASDFEAFGTDLTDVEFDLLRLFQVRSEFWRAWRGCVQTPDVGCANLKSEFEATTRRLRPDIGKHFEDDLDHYLAEAASWE